MLTLSAFLFLVATLPFVRPHNIRVADQTFWPATIPLAVRSPYFSCWLPMEQNENPLAQWPQFWNYANNISVQTLGREGLVRVDGTTYQWLGSWTQQTQQSGARSVIPAKLTSFQITPTRTILTILAGAMNLNVTFLTPIEPSDWVRQSIPFSYVALEASSNDGQPHDFQVYADISAEWLSANGSSVVNWTTTSTSSIVYHEIKLTSPIPYGEVSGQANDGTMYHAMVNGAGVSFSTGSDESCRNQFQDSGGLNGSLDSDFRPITSNFPVFPFSVGFGSISSTPSPAVWAVGYVRDPVIHYTRPDGTKQSRGPYYRANFSSPMEFVCRSLNIIHFLQIYKK
ncbi:hypothetical protein OBBRIDRAFT_725019 [Obba rivulosa]|uniref:Glutaminase A N-terminal domain-containing protein n=1 Tax=Obba rivulosa TaxID=1052685 RepID=A0A8E2DPH2_9APHY|nr:hypothetical protein OBBRIDRAFT_725019 [Obba rivulosa]